MLGVNVCEVDGFLGDGGWVGAGGMDHFWRISHWGSPYMCMYSAFELVMDEE